jgi:AGCS family alanine or glycine:cation symporter
MFSSQYLFNFLELADNFLWSYASLATIIFCGLYFTFKSKFYQIKVLFNIKKHLKSLLEENKKERRGVSPIKLYFASLGGMIGIGNLVSVMSTITIGGPGSLVWLWIASFLGMIVKYCEIYLGIKYRKINDSGGYDGGPTYYLTKAFGNKSVAIIFAILLCIYGAEVSQFLVLTDTFVSVFNISRPLVVASLLILVLISALGGVKRLANVCSWLLPPFLLIYVGVAICIFAINIEKIPGLFLDIISSAFVGYAPLGGFVGSTMLLAAHYGVSRAVYSGDIGIGYDATVLSESKTNYPEKQARMAVLSLLIDSLICTISIMIVLLTGVWNQEGSIKLSEYVMLAISTILPFSDIFMSMMFFVAGFTTIIGYLVVGQKCAKFLHPRYGQKIYIAYAICAFVLFSFYDQSAVMLIMSVSGGCLLICNLTGLFKLRNEIQFPEND